MFNYGTVLDHEMFTEFFVPALGYFVENLWLEDKFRKRILDAALRDLKDC